MFKNVLCLSPHMDDEVLGCGGVLETADKVHIHYFNDYHPYVDKKSYNREAQEVKKWLGCTTSLTEYPGVNALHEYPIKYFINEIEKLIGIYIPDTLLIPFPDYNQDHRTVYEAAITACRIHDVNFIVDNVLLYEQPCTNQTNRVNSTFIPQVFVPINLERKLDLYSLYTSQVREHRSVDHVRALATVRGMQCGYDYAEAFQIVRIIL